MFLRLVTMTMSRVNKAYARHSAVEDVRSYLDCSKQEQLKLTLVSQFDVETNHIRISLLFHCTKVITKKILTIIVTFMACIESVEETSADTRLEFGRQAPTSKKCYNAELSVLALKNFKLSKVRECIILKLKPSTP